MKWKLNSVYVSLYLLKQNINYFSDFFFNSIVIQKKSYFLQIFKYILAIKNHYSYTSKSVEKFVKTQV